MFIRYFPDFPGTFLVTCQSMLMEAIHRWPGESADPETLINVHGWRCRSRNIRPIDAIITCMSTQFTFIPDWFTIEYFAPVSLRESTTPKLKDKLILLIENLTIFYLGSQYFVFKYARFILRFMELGIKFSLYYNNQTYPLKGSVVYVCSWAGIGPGLVSSISFDPGSYPRFLCRG